jgi:hypothetical protein
MDHIDKILASASDNPYKFSPAIRAALAIGKNVMNKYYNKTDHSEVYRTAMGTVFVPLFVLSTNYLCSVLHPRHKLEYFKKHGWDADWTDTAAKIVRDEFDRSYASLDVEDDDSAMRVDIPVCFFRVQFLCTLLTHTYCQVISTSGNIFDNLPDLAPTLLDQRDELDRYLAMDVEDVKDGLMWWYERRAAFPRLSRMARDYLCIPCEVYAVRLLLT